MDVTPEHLAALAKRYRAGDLEAAGELIALGTDRADELARAYGKERMPEQALARLAEVREKRGDDGVAQLVATEIEGATKRARACVAAMRLRATRVLHASALDTASVLAATDGPGPWAVIAHGDDVYGVPRAKLGALARSLRGADVSWAIVEYAPGGYLLESRYTKTYEITRRGPRGRISLDRGTARGRVRFALGLPLADDDVAAYLPDGVAPTAEVRRTFGRPLDGAPAAPIVSARAARPRPPRERVSPPRPGPSPRGANVAATKAARRALRAPGECLAKFGRRPKHAADCPGCRPAT